MIVLQTPKGWTGPKIVDGVQVEGTFRAHQVPISNARGNPEHLRQLEEWMRSYRPEELFDDNGALAEELAALAPRSYRRMGANPHANGGLLLRDLDLPDFRAYAVRGDQAGRRRDRGHPAARPLAAGRDQAQSGDVPAVRAGRDGLQPAPGRVRGDQPGLRRGDPAHRRPPGPGRPGHGGAVGAPVRGLAGGLPADRPARSVQLLRGVHPHRRLDVQPARQVARVLQPASNGAGRSPR